MNSNNQLHISRYEFLMTDLLLSIKGSKRVDSPISTGIQLFLWASSDGKIRNSSHIKHFLILINNTFHGEFVVHPTEIETILP